MACGAETMPYVSLPWSGRTIVGYKVEVTGADGRKREIARAYDRRAGRWRPLSRVADALRVARSLKAGEKGEVVPVYG